MLLKVGQTSDQRVQLRSGFGGVRQLPPNLADRLLDRLDPDDGEVSQSGENRHRPQQNEHLYHLLEWLFRCCHYRWIARLAAGPKDPEHGVERPMPSSAPEVSTAHHRHESLMSHPEGRRPCR